MEQSNDRVAQNQIFYQASKSNGRHSVTYFYMLALIIYYPIMFYLRNFEENSMGSNSVGYYLPLAFLFLMEIYLIWNLFFKRTCIDGYIKLLILLFTILSLICFFVVGSGLERAIGLQIILMSLALFKAYPIKKYEWNSLFVLFATVVAIILLDNIIDSNINTNTSGFLLFILFCISYVRYSQTKKYKFLICALFCFILQLFFASRTALFGSILFVLLALCFGKKNLKRKTAFWLVIIISLLGILFAWIYSEVLFPNIGRGKLILFGKDLFTGRENIWHFTFQSIEDNFWFGAGSHVNENLIQEGYDEIYYNIHNQPLGILASFGVLPLVSFYVSFAYIVSHSYNRKTKRRIIPVLFIIVILFICYFETYFFVQMQWLAIVLAYGLICGYKYK